MALPEVLERFTATLDGLGLDKVTLSAIPSGAGSSSASPLGFPGRVVELVFSDTLAVSREWGLADEAMRHPLGLLGLATPIGGGCLRAHVDHPSPSARRRGVVGIHE